MRYLLDTHVLLWWLNKDKRLSPEAENAISNPTEFIYMSAVSAWEISIKRATGKLQVVNDFDRYARDGGIEELPITIEHANAAGQLPLLHKDPFDRMLVAQAMLEDMTLITRDRNVARYAVNVLPA